LLLNLPLLRNLSRESFRDHWTRFFISLVERGIQSPNIAVLLKIAEVLSVPVANLIIRSPERYP
jgi:hypothetical protein